MKRMFMIVLCLSMLVSLCSCGNTEETKKTEPKSAGSPTTAQAQEDTNAKQTETNESESKVELADTRKIPLMNIYYDYPNWHFMGKANTDLYILSGIRYVSFTVNDDDMNISTLEEAHQMAFEDFIVDIQNQSFVNSLSVVTDSTETINGIDVYKFEGTLNCGHDTVYDAFVIGYSFYMDGYPCMILGSVIDQEQPAEMITDIRDTVEAMMLSVRNEK
jgi:hypothetical protein